jgi:hypothetical protein
MTRFLLGEGYNIPHFDCSQILVFYSTSPCTIWKFKEDQTQCKMECIQTHFYLFSNQEYECMYGNFKYHHAIKLIQVHNLGKEGQCELWGIYHNFQASLDPK